MKAVLLFVVVWSVYGYNISDIRALRKNLFLDSGYDRKNRPSVNQSEYTEIEIKMSINSISNYNAVTGQITILGYLTLRWTDELLQWSSDDFGGVTRIGISEDEIWVPEIHQVSNFDEDKLFSTSWLNENGRVGMIVVGNFIGFCDVDILYFPLDEQSCGFSLISPKHEAAEVKLSLIKDYIETTELIKHGEWNIIETVGYPYSYVEEDIDVKVGGLYYKMKLKRRPMFVMIHTTAPLFLLALLNMVIYVVPIQSGERISFSVTVLLAMIFFTSSIADNMPHTALNVPVLSMATSVLITLCTVNVIVSVSFSRVAANKFKPVTGCLHTCVTFFLSNRFGKGFKKQHVHPSEILKVRAIDEMTDEGTPGQKETTNPPTSDKEIEITWLVVVDVFDWIMFYVHLLFVVTALVIAILFITDVI